MHYASIPQLFLLQSTKYSGRTALKAKKDGRYQSISWNHYRAQVNRVAAALTSLGIARGARVALLSENRPEWSYVDLAVLGIGAVLVPIYATSSAKEVEYVIQHSGSEILFVSNAEQLGKTISLKNTCPSIRKVIVFSECASESESCLRYEDFINLVSSKTDENAARDYESHAARVAPDDLATIIYTSGTTGPPKGVMLTHRNFLINCDDAARAIPMDENDVTLSFLPLSHVFERMAGYYYPIQQGATICYAESMNTVPQNLLEIKPTVACAVPRLYEKIQGKILDEIRKKPLILQRIAAWALEVGRVAGQLRLSCKSIPWLLRLKYLIADVLVFSKIRRGLGGRLRFFISGGAPLPKALGEFFYSAGVLILEGYGLTETSPVIAVNRPSRLKFGTVGPLFDHVRVKIADDGEILVSGPSIMKGYYQNLEATNAVINDGWFATGDIGSLDADGFLKITDRKKELIVTSGGKKVSPQNVENLLCSSRFIKQAVVVGDKFHYLVALILPNLEAIADELKIPVEPVSSMEMNPLVQTFLRQQIDSCTAELANYEKIKYFRFLPKELSIAGGELTPTLKAKRKIIESQYAALISDMYAEGEQKKGA